jgi:hypothetical protein
MTTATMALPGFPPQLQTPLRTRTDRTRFGWVIVMLALFLPTLLLAAEPFPCHRADPDKFIDGRLDEWSEPYLALAEGNWRLEEGSTAVYGGLFDLSATLRLAWDDKHLYAGIAVVDDLFLPEQDQLIDKSDVVILRVAPAIVPANADSAPQELIITQTSPMRVYRRDPAAGLMPVAEVAIGMGRTLLSLPDTPIPCEACKPAAKHITKIFYELAIPWSLLPDFTPCAGADIGLEVQVLDVDGGDLRGRLKWRGVSGVRRTTTDLGRVRLSAQMPR